MSSDFQSVIQSHIDEHQRVLSDFGALTPVLGDIASRMIACLEEGGKILLFGNGGSAADAQHIAAEFSIRFLRERKALAGLALTTDTSVLTACGNDYGFESVFSRQLEALARPGDVVIGISTSGTSKNIVAGLQIAKELGCVTVAFTGLPRGDTANLCADLSDHAVVIPSEITARSQECHILAGHILCDLVDRHWTQDS